MFGDLREFYHQSLHLGVSTGIREFGSTVVFLVWQHCIVHFPSPASLADSFVVGGRILIVKVLS
jgi:hypothetical protein